MMTGDARLDNPMAKLYALCDAVACYNDPLTHAGNVGRSAGKPTSRAPGQQQCPGAVRSVERILLSAVKEVERTLNNATPRDAGAVRRVVMADREEIAETLEALYAVGDGSDTH